MIYDSLNLGISSPAALLVYNQTIEINGNNAYSYIGTRPQMGIIYGNTGNRDLIINALTKLGYSNVNFNSTNTWSSSQSFANSAWACSGGNWNGNGDKNWGRLVVPFFAVL